MITTEEISNELESMLTRVSASTLYASRLSEIIRKLKTERYRDISSISPSDEIVFDLQCAGFPDLAKKIGRSFR